MSVDQNRANHVKLNIYSRSLPLPTLTSDVQQGVFVVTPSPVPLSVMTVSCRRLVERQNRGMVLLWDVELVAHLQLQLACKV